jgi:hypothetical protein
MGKGFEFRGREVGLDFPLNLPFLQRSGHETCRATAAVYPGLDPGPE